MHKSDITFQEDIFLKLFKIDKDSIIDPLYEILSQAVSQYDIKSLNKVIIKDVALFESNLGRVEFDDWYSTLSTTLILGYITAVNLRKDSHFFSESKYKNALATLWHELFHIYDREKVIQPLLDSENNPPTSLYSGINFWSEFYAVYSTFAIYEQPHVLQDFDAAYSANPAQIQQVRYNASRILGYWTHQSHSQACDYLIHKHIKSTTFLSQISKHLMEMLEKYPSLTINDFTTLDSLANGLIPYAAQ